MRRLGMAMRRPKPVCNCILCPGPMTEKPSFSAPAHASTPTPSQTLSAQKDTPVAAAKVGLCQRVSRFFGRDKVKWNSVAWKDDDQRSETRSNTCGLRQICRVFRSSMTRQPNRKNKHSEKARPMLTTGHSLDVGPEVCRKTSTPLTLNPVRIAYETSTPPSTHDSSMEVNISAQDTSSFGESSCSPNQQTDVAEEQRVPQDGLYPASRSLRPSSSHAVAPIGCTYEEWWKTSTAPQGPSPSLEEPPAIPARSSSRTPWRSRSLLGMASLRPKPSCGSMSSALSSWNPFQLPGPSRTSFTDLFDIFQRGNREGLYLSPLAGNESSTSLLHDESSMSPGIQSQTYPSPQSTILQAISEKRGPEETTNPSFKYTQSFDRPSNTADSLPRLTPSPKPFHKVVNSLPTPPWTDSQCSSTYSPVSPTTGCRGYFESIESRFSSTGFSPTDSDSKWLEPYTDTPSCPPLDAPKRRITCSSWTSTLTSEDDDSHLTAIKDVIARNMTPDWERFEEVSCKFPTRLTAMSRSATPPAGLGRWAGYGRRLSTAVEEGEEEEAWEERRRSLGEERRRSLGVEREGAWWRDEGREERKKGDVQERYPGLSSGEWKGKARGYSDRGDLICV